MQETPIFQPGLVQANLPRPGPASPGTMSRHTTIHLDVSAAAFPFAKKREKVALTSNVVRQSYFSAALSRLEDALGAAAWLEIATSS